MNTEGGENLCLKLGSGLQITLKTKTCSMVTLLPVLADRVVKAFLLSYITLTMNFGNPLQLNIALQFLLYNRRTKGPAFKLGSKDNIT
jgi:hypothetical protein